MTERLTLKRTDSGFDDDMLKRVAARLKENHGILATVPYEVHAHAAERLSIEAKKLCFAQSGRYEEAIRFARSSYPHLAFLTSCEFSGNARECDVEIQETTNHE